MEYRAQKFLWMNHSAKNTSEKPIFNLILAGWMLIGFSRKELTEALLALLILPYI